MALAFLFPGQASQFVGMGRDLYEAFEAARRVFDLADGILDMDLKAACFEGPEEALKQTAVTQVAVFVHSVAALEVLKGKGIIPDCAAGHSVGELAALVCAGVLTIEDGIRLVRIRGKAMQQAGDARPGTMAAILGLDDEEVVDACEASRGAGIVTAANFNCPGQVVISGEPAGVARAIEEAGARGAKRAIELPVSGAFHSELMRPAVEVLAGALEGMAFSPGKIPVAPNVTAEPTQHPDLLKSLLIEQIVSPVKWKLSMQNLIAGGVDRALEVGPGDVLKGLMRRIDRSAKVEPAGTAAQIDEMAG